MVDFGTIYAPVEMRNTRRANNRTVRTTESTKSITGVRGRGPQRETETRFLASAVAFAGTRYA